MQIAAMNGCTLNPEDLNWNELKEFDGYKGDNRYGYLL